MCIVYRRSVKLPVTMWGFYTAVYAGRWWRYVWRLVWEESTTAGVNVGANNTQKASNTCRQVAVQNVRLCFFVSNKPRIDVSHTYKLLCKWWWWWWNWLFSVRWKTRNPVQSTALKSRTKADKHSKRRKTVPLAELVRDLWRKGFNRKVRFEFRVKELRGDGWTERTGTSLFLCQQQTLDRCLTCI